MAKIDIFSGFLGAGKTTLIRKLIKEAYSGEKLVLIENEFGEIAIDGGFLADAGIEITEMNSGCICCTLVGDFTTALQKVMTEYNPDRILIEPSGVGKLSDVSKAVEKVDGAEVGCKVTVVDAGKCKIYARNFGEFFNDQVINADVIVMSRTDSAKEEKIIAAAEQLRELNPNCSIVSTVWDKLDGKQFAEVMDGTHGLKTELEEMEAEMHEHEHHHHHGHDEDCECGCHDHAHDHDHEHEHHHNHDEECECGCHEHEHEHHHEHGEECNCGCHDHDHEHHHHHADEIFTSWGIETPKKFTEEKIRECLEELDDCKKYGTVLRAKGMVDTAEGDWIYFDYVPGETDIRRGLPAVIGKLCVIGSKINETAIAELFTK